MRLTPRSVRARGDRAAAIVEFAVVVPLLLALVFGIVDFGIAVNRDTLINNAAREGAREASLNPDRAAIVSVVQSSVRDLSSTPVVTVTCRKISNAACTMKNSATGTAGNVTSGDWVTVRVEYPHSWVTFVPRSVGLGSSTTLRKSVEMRVE